MLDSVPGHRLEVHHRSELIQDLCSFSVQLGCPGGTTGTHHSPVGRSAPTAPPVGRSATTALLVGALPS